MEGYQYDLNMNLIKKWNNSRECQKQGFKYRSVSMCCNGHRKTHKGYIWSHIKLKKKEGMTYQ